MTKFVGEAIGVRAKAKGYSAKERAKDMEKFKETGVHPEVQRVRSDTAQSTTFQPLPPQKSSRPHAFLELAINKRDIGRVVVEVFDDIAPAPAVEFLRRCSSAPDCFAGTFLHKILRGLAIIGGHSTRHLDVVQMRASASLHHSEQGAVSISADGSEFCIVAAPAPLLDATHRVIGRVTVGLEVVEQAASVPTATDDAPLQVIEVRRCGLTDVSGSIDTDIATAGGAAELNDAALQRRDADVREAAQDAVVAGLKRKQPTSGSASRERKRIAADALLLGESSESSSDGE